MEQAGEARQHSVLGKTFHWGFIILYAYGIFKQIDELEELEDSALLAFEVAFATVFLGIVMIRYSYMRRFENFMGATEPVPLAAALSCGRLVMLASSKLHECAGDTSDVYQLLRP